MAYLTLGQSGAFSKFMSGVALIALLGACTAPAEPEEASPTDIAALEAETQAEAETPANNSVESAAAPVTRANTAKPDAEFFKNLRKMYQGPIETWPAIQTLDGSKVPEMGPLPPPRHPADNPKTDTKVALGKKLFDDPRLSKSGQIACSNCHQREIGWTDRLATSFGHDRQRGKRNAISLLNVSYYDTHFWDGRAPTLEEQALAALTNDIEMAAETSTADSFLRQSKEYAALFEPVFGKNSNNLDNGLKAIGAFVREQRSFTRFDTFLNGRRNVLNDQQIWGLHLFRTKAMCMTCHSGPTMTDNKFHNLGIHFVGRPNEDMGRYNVTGKEEDRGAFRTSTLRGVSQTGPWMHTGTFRTFFPVVALYNMGGLHTKPTEKIPHPPKTSPLLRPLKLTPQEMQAIVDFMEIL